MTYFDYSYANVSCLQLQPSKFRCNFNSTVGKLIKLFLQDNSIAVGDEATRIEAEAFTEVENSEGGSNNGGIHCGRI